MATSTPRHRSTAAIIASSVLAAGLTATAVGWAPTAGASCASFFGLGTTADCSSTLTSFAVAIGPGSQAHADGLFGGAFTIGNNSLAQTSSTGWFNTAFVLGDNDTAQADGVLSLAVVAGKNTALMAGNSSADFLNVAASFGATASSTARAYGRANLAFNLFANSDLSAIGNGNIATGFGGSNSQIYAGGNLSTAFGLFTNASTVSTKVAGTGDAAFSIGGTNVTVTAGPGPFAFAGAILRDNATIIKNGPGVNINGVVVGGASAVSGKKAKSPARSSTKSSESSTKSTGGSARK